MQILWYSLLPEIHFAKLFQWKVYLKKTTDFWLFIVSLLSCSLIFSYHANSIDSKSFAQFEDKQTMLTILQHLEIVGNIENVDNWTEQMKLPKWKLGWLPRVCRLPWVCVHFNGIKDETTPWLLLRTFRYQRYESKNITIHRLIIIVSREILSRSFVFVGGGYHETDTFHF